MSNSSFNSRLFWLTKTSKKTPNFIININFFFLLTKIVTDSGTTSKDRFATTNHFSQLTYWQFSNLKLRSGETQRTLQPSPSCCGLDRHGHGISTGPWNSHSCFRPNNSIPRWLSGTHTHTLTHTLSLRLFVILEDRLYVLKNWSILFNLLAGLCRIRLQLCYPNNEWPDTQGQMESH